MDQVCKQCGVGFPVTSADLEFYDKISPVFGDKKCPIPPPTLCPDCRMRRRIAWRNERFMYQRTCDMCKKSMVSIYPPETKCPIYCNTCWWGDSWDGKSYGQEFDFNRPFFEQLKEVMDKTPQLAIQNDNGIGSQNCEYCQDFAYGKNCYFVVGTWYTQGSFYCNINASYNSNICDCSNVSKSELVYESIDSQGLYHCGFMQCSENCSDCFFGFDLKGCKNCFGCIGLRQKQFYIFNQPYMEEEYKKKMSSYNLGSHQAVEYLKTEYAKWILSFPRKNMNMQNCENCEGDNLLNCKNTYGFCLLDSEGCKFCGQGDLNKFSYDIFNSGRPNWCYEGMTPDDSYMTHFSWFSWKNKYVLYGINCHSSEYLFGCVSLHRAKYCILNKQYTKEQYEELVPRIIGHMKKTGEFGEFLPIELSVFPYNETVAQEYFPFTKEEVTKRGWKWREKDLKQYLPQACVIPDDIVHVQDTISQEILACTLCGKNFKIIPQELLFYRKMHLPIPHLCPNCRHAERLKKRPPYKRWERTCAKCSEPMKTVYAPERSEIVYCEKCYLESVY